MPSLFQAVGPKNIKRIQNAQTLQYGDRIETTPNTTPVARADTALKTAMKRNARRLSDDIADAMVAKRVKEIEEEQVEIEERQAMYMEGIEELGAKAAEWARKNGRPDEWMALSNSRL